MSTDSSSPAERWRTALMALPLGRTSRRIVTPATRHLVIHRGRFTLRQGPRVAKLRGKITLHWYPVPELRFEGQVLARQPELDLAASELRTTSHGVRGRVLILGKRFHTGRRFQYSGMFSPLAVLGQRRNVRSVQFELVNFPDYVGRQVRIGPDEAPSFSRGRLCLRSRGWRVELYQNPKCGDLLNEVRSQGGCATTHSGVIRRVGGRPISFDQADDFVSCLHFFFAFLAGQWVGPVHSAGLGQASPTWERLGSWKVTAGKKPRSWFPGHQPQGIEQLLGCFRHLWLDSLWNRALRTAIYWYVQANVESGSTEAAIVAAFVPLELLAWLVVVEHGGHMSAKRFDGLKTAERLEETLRHSGIPLQIPPDFAVLRRSSLSRSRRNGPRCLTRVRNALVHPRRARRKFLARVDSMALFELKELALTYVELTLLSVLGYRGPYGRRVFDGWKGDHLIEVPWI